MELSQILEQVTIGRFEQILDQQRVSEYELAEANVRIKIQSTGLTIRLTTYPLDKSKHFEYKQITMVNVFDQHLEVRRCYEHGAGNNWLCYPYTTDEHFPLLLNHFQ